MPRRRRSRWCWSWCCSVAGWGCGGRRWRGSAARSRAGRPSRFNPQVPPAPQPVPPGRLTQELQAPEAGVRFSAPMPPPPEDVLKGLDADERNNVQVYSAVNQQRGQHHHRGHRAGLLRRRDLQRQRVGVRHRQGRAHPHQFPRRPGRGCGARHAVRRLGAGRRGRRRRRRQRRRRAEDPGARQEARAGRARRLVAGDGGPEDPGDRQPVRAGADADLGDRQQPGAVAQVAERPDDQGDHPDGCGRSTRATRAARC